MSVEQREIKSLTGLRGVAAIVVVAFHYSSIMPSGRFGYSAIGPGYLAVDLFFILSGFVLAANYGRYFAAGFSLTAYLTFLERRFARVYPLLLVAVLAAYTLNKLHVGGNAAAPTQSLATNLLAVQNLGPGLLNAHLGDSLDNPTWSISTEAGAYLVFPWLAVLMLFRSWRLCAAVVVVLALGLLVTSQLPLAWFADPGQHGPLDLARGTTLWPLLRCLADFLLGLATWRVSRQPWSLATRRPLWLDAALLGGLLAAWCVRGTDGLIVLIFPGLIWQVCTDHSPLARLLGSPLALWLGGISYALYLTHYPAVVTLSRLLYPRALAAGIPAPWATTLSAIAMFALAVAWLAYRCIERPARRFLRGLRRIEPPLGSSGAARPDPLLSGRRSG